MKLFYRKANTIVKHSQTMKVGERSQEDGTVVDVVVPLQDDREIFLSINAAKRRSRELQAQGWKFQVPA